jgi:hypothetical protein
MPPAGFEPEIPAGERLQTHALDRSVTGMGKSELLEKLKPKIAGRRNKMMFHLKKLLFKVCSS